MKWTDWAYWSLFAVIVVLSVIAVHVWFAPLLTATPLSFGALIVGIVPAFLVAQHGVYLARFKPGVIKRALSSPKPNPGGSAAQSRSVVEYDQDIKATLSATAQQSIFLYIILAAALAIIATILMAFSCSEPGSVRSVLFRASPAASGTGEKAPPKESLELGDATAVAKYWPALRLSAAGAFIYVLIVLGKRNYQRDITQGLACWCIVQLVLGPMLGCTLAYLLISETPSGNSSTEATSQATPKDIASTAKVPPVKFGNDPTVSFGIAILYLFAGLSPRLVADLISETAARMWPGSAPHQNVGVRVVPLGQVRGITRGIEERLMEEGIEDALALSLANPLRLMRNTPYDARLVLGWIDEAFLMVTLPQHWQALENEGITGAMDLSCYYWLYGGPDAVEETQMADNPDVKPPPTDSGGQQSGNEAGETESGTSVAPGDSPSPDPLGVPSTHPAESAIVTDNPAGSDKAGHQEGPLPESSAAQETKPQATPDQSQVPALQQSKAQDAISKLADRINMRPDSLREVIERLAKDSQVNLLWALYDLGSDENVDE